MKAIIRQEVKNYLKNPILWLGLLLVLFNTFQVLRPYFDIRYFQSSQEIQSRKVKVISDADVMEGYVPSSKERQIKDGCKALEKQLVKHFDVSAEEAKAAMEKVQSMGLTVPEIDQYLEKHYSYHGAVFQFQESKTHQGTKKEVNSYIRKKLTMHPFSYYFSQKFADYVSVDMGFFAMVLLIFLFLRDTGKDTYELLHTKPISAKAYISGKIIGGFLAMLGCLAVIIVFYSILCWQKSSQLRSPFRLWDIPLATLLYILPCVLMITSVYAFVSIVFKNPLPAFPMIFLYLVYSNMGSAGPDGVYDYYGRFLAVLERFPGSFFESAPPAIWPVNQIFLLMASGLLTLLTIQIWKRRRAY